MPFGGYALHIRMEIIETAAGQAKSAQARRLTSSHPSVWCNRKHTSLPNWNRRIVTGHRLSGLSSYIVLRMEEKSGEDTNIASEFWGGSSAVRAAAL